MAGLSKPKAERPALALATRAALGQQLDPRGPGSGEPCLAPGTAPAYKPMGSFSSCSVRRMLAFKYFKSRGQRRGTAKRESASDLQPRQTQILARSSTKCLTGPSLRQNSMPSPHGSCLSAP